ncbi:hypothetical protein H5410_061369, partial [Solanum commersonii]
MDAIEQKGTKRLKEGRKKCLKIDELSWRVVNHPGDHLLFQCVKPYRKDQAGNEIEQSACQRGRKTKTTKLIAGGIGLTWVQLER